MMRELEEDRGAWVAQLMITRSWDGRFYTQHGGKIPMIKYVSHGDVIYSTGNIANNLSITLVT